MAKKKFSEFDLITALTNQYIVGYNPATLKNVRVLNSVFKLKNTVAKTASYIILDDDGVDRIESDTTSGDCTYTLPTRSDNLKRRIEIANVKGGTNKVIIVADGGESKITSDGLAAVWLPKIGDYIVLQECATSGFWEVVDEKITCELVLNTQAGVGDGNNNKIMRLTNIVKNVGNMFSENHTTGYTSNTKGLEITANRSGFYSFTVTGYDAGASGNIGFSLNSSQLTTSIDSITITNRMALSGFNPSIGCASVRRWLVKGDVVRLHNTGQSAMTNVVFTATYG